MASSLFLFSINNGKLIAIEKEKEKENAKEIEKYSKRNKFVHGVTGHGFGMAFLTYNDD